MSTTAEEITVEIDGKAADGTTKAVDKTKNGSAASGTDTQVVVDADLGGKTAAADGVTTDEAVAKLEKQLNDERTARIAAESRASEAARGEADARAAAQTSQLDQVKGAIAQVTQANDALESQVADAMAAQDFKTVAKLQRQMSDNSAKLAQLEAGKRHLENAPRPAPRAAIDPVEAYIAEGKLSPKSAAWVRAHPQFARDEAGQRRLLHAHHAALATGAEAESTEYFREVEQLLKVSPDDAARHLPAHHDDPQRAAAPTEDTAAQPTGGRQVAPAAAPVSRSTAAGGGGQTTRVKLSPEEAEIALATFPNSKDPYKDYALQKLELKREGKLS